MKKQFYKLVSVEETELTEGQPYIISVMDSTVSEKVWAINQNRPDFVLNWMAGGAGVFNLKNLLTNEKQA